MFAGQYRLPAERPIGRVGVQHALIESHEDIDIACAVSGQRHAAPGGLRQTRQRHGDIPGTDVVKLIPGQQVSVPRRAEGRVRGGRRRNLIQHATISGYDMPGRGRFRRGWANAHCQASIGADRHAAGLAFRQRCQPAQDAFRCITGQRAILRHEDNHVIQPVGAADRLPVRRPQANVTAVAH